MNRKIALNQLRELKNLGSKDMRLAAEGWDQPWKTLIAITMSARTRDEVTIPVAIKLFKRYNSLYKLAHSDVKEVENIIKPVNFYKNKSKNIINCAKLLVKEYKMKVPLSFDELLNLPGVGRKTGNVFLSEYGNHGLGVDTHVSYISRKLDWTKHKNPSKIEEDLKKLFPKSYWNKVNPTLVRFGKTYTSKRKKDALLLQTSKIK